MGYTLISTDLLQSNFTGKMMISHGIYLGKFSDTPNSRHMMTYIYIYIIDIRLLELLSSTKNGANSYNHGGINTFGLIHLIQLLEMYDDVYIYICIANSE